jgi:hypothetical protein
MAINPNTALPLISFQRIMTAELPAVDWIVDRLIAQGDIKEEDLKRFIPLRAGQGPRGDAL